MKIFDGGDKRASCNLRCSIGGDGVMSPEGRASVLKEIDADGINGYLLWQRVADVLATGFSADSIPLH